jgi:hypothetical protein
MKIFLDDFTIFSDMSIHFKKLKKCFLKCREFNIHLNPSKCAFLLILGTILGFIVSKERKVVDPKKVEALINMLVLITPFKIQVFNNMAQFYRCFIKTFALVMSPITKLFKKSKVFEWTKKCKNMWDEIKN